MGRSPCCSKEGLNRGAWTVFEDKILTDYVLSNGEGGWRNLPQKAGLERCGKSCRLRWLNYLRPDIKRGNISSDEEELIIRLHKLLGNRWSLIAGRLPGRTDNEIKNYWNTNLRKKNPNVQPKHTSKPPASTTKPEPIRTKAFRCTKTIIPNLQSPKTSHSISTTTSSSLEKQAQESPQDSYNSKTDIGVERIISGTRASNSEFLKFSSDDGQASNENKVTTNNSYERSLYYETDHPLQFGNLFSEDWSKSIWLDDNVHTDLGYFSFLLDDCEKL